MVPSTDSNSNSRSQVTGQVKMDYASFIKARLPSLVTGALPTSQVLPCLVATVFPVDGCTLSFVHPDISCHCHGLFHRLCYRWSWAQSTPTTSPQLMTGSSRNYPPVMPRADGWRFPSSTVHGRGVPSWLIWRALMDQMAVLAYQQITSQSRRRHGKQWDCRPGGQS